MNTSQTQARARFFATLEIARRELRVLDYSARKLFAQPIDVDWVERLAQDMEAAETLEAFISRFGRVQDTIGDKLIPRALAALLERPGSMLDNLTRAERLGWIEDTNRWVTARELRKRLVHEYMTDAAQLATDIKAAPAFVVMLRSAYRKLLQEAEDRFGVTESALQEYL